MGHDPHPYRRYFVYELARVWMLPQALRAAWLPARLVKWFLPAFKELWMADPIGDERLFLGSSLLSIGVRHQKQRSRIQKLLARVREHPSEAAANFDRWISARFFDAMNQVDDDTSASSVGARLLLLSRQAPAGDGLGPTLEHMPEELHATLAANLALPLWDQEGGLELYTATLSQVARFEARDFYLPARYASLVHERYSRSSALEYVKVRVGADFRSRRKPYVAPTKPGRNEPCSCGSGKKYKRCCGMN